MLNMQQYHNSWRTTLETDHLHIRCSGSVPMDYGSGTCSFLQWVSKCKLKISFLQSFLLISYFRSILRRSSKITSYLVSRSHKTLKLLIFIGFFACYWKGNRICFRIRINNYGFGSQTLIILILPTCRQRWLAAPCRSDGRACPGSGWSGRFSAWQELTAGYLPPAPNFMCNPK